MAEKQSLKNVRFEKGSVLDLPFENESFDFVYCKGVLHHTGDLNKGVEELYRVLRTNGKAFLYLYGSGGLFWHSRKEVKKVMQQIPLEYTLNVLSLIRMPAKRTIFVDNWYVVIEDLIDPLKLEPFLIKVGFNNINRWKVGKDYHLETAIFKNLPNAKDIWGVGELRYILEKQ
jgi:ubiquinone/menaquinone biosynthesis C-methylase UbiE